MLDIRFGEILQILLLRVSYDGSELVDWYGKV